MDDEREDEVTAPACWTEPVTAAPITDLLDLAALIAAYGVPLDAPEAFPGVVEDLAAAGRRTGIVRRREETEE